MIGPGPLGGWFCHRHAAANAGPPARPTAARLRACLNAGQWLVAGHGVIAGTKVVELVTAGGALRLWVSAATCLPVRLRSSGPDAPDITFTFAFLAPTRANLAMLTPPVPAAFAKRPI